MNRISENLENLENPVKIPVQDKRKPQKRNHIVS
jgi:hypothetical protein